MEEKIIWTCGFLLLILKGCSSANVQDQHVKVLTKAKAWQGSCLTLPCECTTKETITKLIWYYNATYDHGVSAYNGTIVYSSDKNDKVDVLFDRHVQRVEKNNMDCTIVISNIQKQHSGFYSVRLLGNNYKWMSQNVTIEISDTGPPLKILPLPEKMTESQSVTLTCSIDYYCPDNIPSLRWLGEINGTTTASIKYDTNGLRTSSSLTFRPSWKDNEKTISCILDRDKGESYNDTIQLNVSYAPKNVQVRPNNATVKIKRGEPLTLTCYVESSNPPVHEITWYKYNQPPSTELKSTSGSADQFKVTSSGKYLCKAKNNIGELASNSVEVFVLYAPEKPSIVISPGMIKEGMDISLTCSTKAYPPVSRSVWYKDGEECYNDTSSLFKISKIKEDDSGSYQCTALNELGKNTSEKMILNVLFAPRHPRVVIEFNRTTFAEKDEVVFVEGDQVTFQCHVNSSNPNVSQITWYKDTKHVNMPSLPLKAGDAGRYSCDAGNSVGRTSSPQVNVDVHYVPKGVEIEVPKEAVKENDYITLTCTSNSSKPNVRSYEWYKDGRLLTTSRSNRMQLRLEWTHTGQYSCKALNDIGSGVSEGKPIEVLYAPRNVTLSVFPGNPVTEYTYVTLTCTSKTPSSQPRYQFYLHEEELSSGEDTYELSVQIKDSGEYSCLAANTVGARRSNVVSLQVSYSPNSIGKFASYGVISFLVLLLTVFLVVRFRVCFRNAFCRETIDDKLDSSFFVLKKSSNESGDTMGRLTPSMHNSTDQLDDSRVTFPASSKRRIHQSSAEADYDVTTVYSAVKKVPTAAEYENIQSSKMGHEDPEIHYSVITNLQKKPADRERGPEVEYAKLRHS